MTLAIFCKYSLHAGTISEKILKMQYTQYVYYKFIKYLKKDEEKNHKICTKSHYEGRTELENHDSDECFSH